VRLLLESNYLPIEADMNIALDRKKRKVSM